MAPKAPSAKTRPERSGANTKDTNDYHIAEINHRRSEGAPAGPAAPRLHCTDVLNAQLPGPEGPHVDVSPRSFSESVFVEKGKEEGKRRVLVCAMPGVGVWRLELLPLVRCPWPRTVQS